MAMTSLATSQQHRALDLVGVFAFAAALSTVLFAAVTCTADDDISPRRLGNHHFPKLSCPTTFASDRTLGTGLSWERSVVEAGEKARREGKLVYVIHVSGNFEDAEFT